MSEVMGWGDETEIAKAAAELVAKEEWIQATARHVVDTWRLTKRRLSPEMALDGVRLASLWKDHFEIMMAAGPPITDFEVKQRIQDSKQRAVDQSETEHRYPASGIPNMRLMIVACDAFCLSFGDQAHNVSQLLEWPMHDYGIPPDGDGQPSTG